MRALIRRFCGIERLSAELGSVTVTEGSSGLTFKVGAAQAATITAHSFFDNNGLSLDVGGSGIVLMKHTGTGFSNAGIQADRIDVGASSGTVISFYGGTGGSKPTITGSRGGNVALANLLSALANLGLITDSTT